MADSTDNTERARRAGRGLVAIVGVKAYHIVTAYGIAVLLPWMLGSPVVYGLWSKVTAALGIVNNVLLVSTIQSVSKLVSEDEANAPRVLRRFLDLQIGISVFVGTTLFVSAPLLADFHDDAAVTPLLRVGAIVPMSYAVYAVVVGYLNGRQRFQQQAKLDATLYTLRAAGILGGAALLGWGALGAISGFAAAAALTTLLAFLVVGAGRSGERPAYGRWLAFLAPLWLYHALLNGILELDIQVLARAVSELAMASGEGPRAAADIANEHVGFYSAAQTFAFVPYHLMLAMTFVVFPMVSRATSTGDEDEARRTIRAAMRFSLLALLSVAAPIAGAADGVMRIAYPDEYLAGAPALEILSIGVAAFALFVVLATILTSAGRPLLTAVIASVGLAVTVACNYLFVVHAGIGEHTLAAAALGTSVGMGVALLLAGAAVYARWKTLLPPAAVLRGGAAAAAAYAVARFVPHADPGGALVAIAAGFLVYVAVVLALREVTAADVKALRAILGSRRE